MKKAGFCEPCSLRPGSPWSNVELAELDAADERHPFVLVEFESRATRVLGVADLDGAVGKNFDGHAATLVRERGQLVTLGRERIRALGGKLLIHEELTFPRLTVGNSTVLLRIQEAFTMSSKF